MEKPELPLEAQLWRESKMCQLLEISKNTLRSLSTPGSENFDHTFPAPRKISKGVNAYNALAVTEWVKRKFNA